MGNEVALREDITEQKIVEFLDSAGITNQLEPNEKKLFIGIAREFQLNPFKREIHITAYGRGEYRKCSIITGYEVYIKRAERTGKLDGWKAWTEGTGRDLKGLVEIYRKDQKYPFTHEVYYEECVQRTKTGEPNAVWAKQPRFMTKKVAIGQAFRLCFPDDLGGMPYEEAELPQYANGAQETEAVPVPEVREQAESRETVPSAPNPSDEQRYKDAMAELGNILDSEEDGKRVFSVAEKDALRETVRKELAEIPADRRDLKLEYITKKLDGQKEILHKRLSPGTPAEPSAVPESVKAAVPEEKRPAEDVPKHRETVNDKVARLTGEIDQKEAARRKAKAAQPELAVQEDQAENFCDSLRDSLPHEEQPEDDFETDQPYTAHDENGVPYEILGDHFEDDIPDWEEGKAGQSPKALEPEIF